MGKLVIKITVYQSVDPDLYDSVSNLPLRRRSAVIRRLWRQGLQPGSQKDETPRPADLPHAQPSVEEEAVAVAADQGGNGADGNNLLRKHLGGLSGLAAFE
jgi:hypothetical protein